jgi:hypothetical protein
MDLKIESSKNETGERTYRTPSSYTQVKIAAPNERLFFFRGTFP